MFHNKCFREEALNQQRDFIVKQTGCDAATGSGKRKKFYFK